MPLTRALRRLRFRLVTLSRISRVPVAQSLPQALPAETSVLWDIHQRPDGRFVKAPAVGAALRQAAVHLAAALRAGRRLGGRLRIRTGPEVYSHGLG